MAAGNHIIEFKANGRGRGFIGQCCLSTGDNVAIRIDQLHGHDYRSEAFASHVKINVYRLSFERNIFTSGTLNTQIALYDVPPQRNRIQRDALSQGMQRKGVRSGGRDLSTIGKQ